MDAQRITPEELEAHLQADVKALAKRMVEAINDAHAEFRQRAYQRALDLLQAKALQEDFSPSEDPPGADVEEQGSSEDLASDD